MNTQQNQNEIKKKGVQVNPSRDIKYDEKEKDFSGEFSGEEGEQLDADSGEEVNPSELDQGEVELDRGGVEFSGGNEEPTQIPQKDSGAFDQAIKNAGSKGSAQGYENNSPDVGMSSDLGGDVSKVSKPKEQKGTDLH